MQTDKINTTEEKRGIGRLDFNVPSAMVLCDTGETIFVQVENASPKGMGLWMKDDRPDILKKDIIIVADTVIMYATVARVDKRNDGTYTVGISAKKFSRPVLEYLFEHIGNAEIA